MTPFSYETPVYSEQMDPGEKPSGGMQTAAVSFAAIGSVVAASSCCLPAFPFAMAAGFAGGSAFLLAARPYLLGAAVLFIAWGFYQARRARQCRRKPGVVVPILLWASTVFVALSIFFPQAMANAAAGLVSGARTAQGQPQLVTLTGDNLTGLRDAFNAASNDVRVLILLSPT